MIFLDFTKRAISCMFSEMFTNVSLFFHMTIFAFFSGQRGDSRCPLNSQLIQTFWVVYAIQKTGSLPQNPHAKFTERTRSVQNLEYPRMHLLRAVFILWLWLRSTGMSEHDHIYICKLNLCYIP